jgi:putative membrane protein
MQSAACTNIRKILSGVVAGTAATLPMTAAMIAMHRYLPVHQRYPLPPRKVTMRLASAVGVKREMDQPQRDAATIAAHFGYGGAMGGIFGLLSPHVPGPRVVSGIGWGLFVWAGSYLGLLPAADLHEPATRHPAERNALMIAAHIIWGATLGALFKWHEPVRRGPRRMQMGRGKRAARPHRIGSHR